MKFIDRYLNKITMYRLTLYYLIILVAFAALFSFMHILPYSGIDIILSALLAVIACYIANLVFAQIFRAPTNVESVFITALILVLIYPIKLPVNAVGIIALSLLAMGSKYLLTIGKKHIFNPAAIAVLMLYLLSNNHAATWWIGTSFMVIPVLVGGLLLTRKMQRGNLLFSFLGTFFALSFFAALSHTGSIGSVINIWKQSFLTSALLFFGFVMLTEPLTLPPTKKLQNIYGIIVGFFYATPFLRIPGLVLTPEMALIFGNIYSYIVSPKYRLILPLVMKKQISPDTYLFVFNKVSDFNFTPGQYMEWTLPHENIDSRGNRRYFSIASAPHENLMMAVKFYNPSSSYKKELMSLSPTQKIIAGSLAGDFVLPKNLTTPLVFIAGGVGIAPFRSILENIIEKKIQCNIIVVFANKTKDDIIFSDTLERAKPYGVRTVYILTDKEKAWKQGWTGRTGYIDEKTLKEAIPDYKNRFFYVSGPQLMVQNFEKILLNAGVLKKNIKADFFPGYSET